MSDREKFLIQDKETVKVSVILITYEQEDVVQESLMSLIHQDYPGLQIVVSDDASTDKTWEIVQEIARQAGPHVRIVLNRNETNLGIIGNYNRAVALCDGDLIFSAAGDDISDPNRVRTCVELWISCGKKADLIATDLFDMSVDGQILGAKLIDDLQAWTWERWIEQRPYHVGASHMVTRRLLAVQPLNEKAKLEDQCLLFRALLMGGALRVFQTLVSHRRGGVSNSGQTNKTYAIKHAMLVASASQEIHEVDQYLSDARILNAPAALINYLSELRRSCQFTVSCLLSEDALARFRLMWKYRDVRLRTRMRFFAFSSLSWVYSLAYAVKYLRK